jgi:hypothetical protein
MHSSSRSADTQDISLDATDSAASKTELYGADVDDEVDGDDVAAVEEDVEVHKSDGDSDGVDDKEEDGGGINFGNDDL